MAGPLEAIRAFHKAFRKDISSMDAARYSAGHGLGTLELILKRYRFFNEMLTWHASGEEDYVFPAIEKVASLIAGAYERDHRGLDSLVESLANALNALGTVEIIRTTSAFSFFLTFRLNKEEAHLYRVFNERLSIPDQGAIIGKMSPKVPPSRFPELVTWLFPLIELDDRKT
jgi:hypothetical protein